MLPASRPRAARRAADLRRARRRHGLGRGRAQARPRRRDHRPRLERQHAAHERAALAGGPLLVRGSPDRRCRARPGGAASGARHEERRRRARHALPDDERSRKRPATLCELVPGSRPPSVLPLSEPGMVAVHALVPAADVWTSCRGSSRPGHRRSCSFRSSACSRDHTAGRVGAAAAIGGVRRLPLGAGDGRARPACRHRPRPDRSVSTATCRPLPPPVARGRARLPVRSRRSTPTRTAAIPGSLRAIARLRRRRAGEHRPGSGGGRS